MAGMKRINTIIIGAAGRDFHNFNVMYRDNEPYNVVAFTATQIPNIAGRKYPAALAGKLYPDGIPIYEEKDLEDLIRRHAIEEVVFSYSDVSYQHVMSLASRASMAGAHFKLPSAPQTMIPSKKPVVSICAVRTGSGKSQTCRKVSRLLAELGLKVAAVRHPMPYGDLEKQKVQRYASIEDLQKHQCTIEEMEEYEPHIVNGTIIYAGVDYKAILDSAEQEADVIVWDGGNNDTSFYKPDLSIVVADPLRVGNELSYYPSETNLRMADVVIINKVDSADPQAVFTLRENIRKVNKTTQIIEAASPIYADQSGLITGKKVLVIEDGPTLTHGEMKFGAGTVAAHKFGASEIIDPRPYCSGEIKKTFDSYPGIGILLPAMGYSEKQVKDLEETINKVPCDTVIIGTPINLARIVKLNKPAVRISYELEEIGTPDLKSILGKFVASLKG
ncbi:MAG: cyclic 2,3-diphosphoglycerate synthase [Ignavibacteriales bacterium]|nr:cyclic 2,3-diphosphoglycerate synthase [Ignavibacteriales bacterium]